jgi:hypothetical protein
MTEIRASWLAVVAVAACHTAEPQQDASISVVALTTEIQGGAATYVGGPAIRLVAKAHYSDGTDADVTTLATWSASNKHVAIAQAGEVAPVSAGVAMITASLDGVAATHDVEVVAALGIVIGMVGGSASMMTYTPTADGAADPVRSFRSSWVPLDIVTAVAVAGDEIFVANRHEIEVFDRSADGAFAPLGQVAPKRKIWGAISQVDDIFTLSVRGAEIFTANTGSIVVHAIEANDQTPPLRVISNTMRAYTWVQVVGNEIFALSTDGHLDTFPATATGASTPIRSIAGKHTGLIDVRGFFATATELFVVNGDEIRVFSSTATGDVEPARVLTGLDGPRTPAVVGSELYVLQLGPRNSSGSNLDGSCAVFDINASGAAMPVRELAIGASSITVSAIAVY